MAGLCFSLIVGSGSAQVTSSETTDALRVLANQAGVIFAGRVVSIARNDASGFVDVRFGIDEAILGCPGAAEYVVREWAGLWAGHAPRYRVGARLLMLLYPPGPSGMSAPVGGMDGVIPLIGVGASPVKDASGTMPADAGGTSAEGPSASFAVDMRWVQTNVSQGGAATAGQATGQVPAPAGVQPGSSVPGSRAQAGAVPATRSVSGGPVRVIVSDPELSGATAALPTLTSVLSVLRAANAQR